jgi:hypothetical protein
MIHIKKFDTLNESKDSMVVDSSVKKVLDKLTDHESSRVSSIAKAMLKNLEFGSVEGGREMKVARLTSKLDREFPQGSIELFVAAFAALHGSSTIKIK